MASSLALIRSTCKLLVGVMLFAQMAIAAHACEGAASMRAAQVAALAADDAMPADCGMATPEAPAKSALCADHCRSGDQSADVPSAVTMPMVPVFLYAIPQTDPAARVQLAGGARSLSVDL